ncbi:MRPL51 54S ribosomal protein L51 [Candida maltosa Xu316]
MPVKAIPKVSIARNGVGSFVNPCHRITIQYCNWGGSSTHLRQSLVDGSLNQYIKSKPNIFFEIKKVKGHPKLTFSYNNSTNQEVIIKNLEKGDIFKMLEEYSSRSGNKLFKFNHKVQSQNDSVRGIWSPLHAPKGYRHRI